LISVIPVFEGCDQSRQGCRIQEGQCLCGKGCYSEYRYSNYDECYKALKGCIIFIIHEHWALRHYYDIIIIPDDQFKVRHSLDIVLKNIYIFENILFT